MTYKISHWAPARVTQVMDPPDQFYVAFDNEPSTSHRLLQRLGTDIAYPGSFTDDFEWRYSIKTGDLLDALDSEAIWYKSTVLDMKSQPQPQIIDEEAMPVN